MHQLLYVSHAAPNLTSSQIEEIRSTARRNNHAHGISGYLIHIECGFLQILEGEREKVLERFAAIAQDPRHSEARVLMDRSIERPAFAGLAIGYAHLEPGNPQARGLYGIVRECVAGHLSPGSGRVVATMLETFARMEMDAPPTPKAGPSASCDSLEILAAR